MFFAAFFQEFVQPFANPRGIVSCGLCLGIRYGQLWSPHRITGICEEEPQYALFGMEPQCINGAFGLGQHHTDGVFPVIVYREIGESHQNVRKDIEGNTAIGEYVPAQSLKAQSLELHACEMPQDAFAHHVGAFEIFRLAKFGKQASPTIWVPGMWRQMRIAFVWRRGQRAVTSVRMVESRRYGRRVYAIRLQAALAGWTRRIASCFAIIGAGKRHKCFWRDHFTSIDCVSGHEPSSISDSLNHINLMLIKKGKLA